MNYRVRQGLAALLIALVLGVLSPRSSTDLSGAAGFIALIGVALIVWGLLTAPSEKRDS